MSWTTTINQSLYHPAGRNIYTSPEVSVHVEIVINTETLEQARLVKEFSDKVEGALMVLGVYLKNLSEDNSAIPETNGDLPAANSNS
jgi:hypothetical protein